MVGKIQSLPACNGFKSLCVCVGGCGCGCVCEMTVFPGSVSRFQDKNETNTDSHAPFIMHQHFYSTWISALHISVTLKLHRIDSALHFLMIKPTTAATFATLPLHFGRVIWENVTFKSQTFTVKEEACSEQDICNKGKRG